jgi:ABC-type transport system involved in multi-copper enzyme maturation permease subunit
MVLGPIFRVEMVGAARRRRYFFLRVVFAALILCVLWMCVASAYSYRTQRELSISEQAMIATTFFVSFMWVQMIGILAVAPAMAVGTIATERERRTIEYLFATDLSNLEIVVGKTIARLLLVGQLLLVSLPILFLFRLLGGIPADLLVASFLIAGSTALAVTALSVCVSVWSKRSKDATIRVYVVLAALLFVPWVLNALGDFYLSNEWWWYDYAAPAFDAIDAVNPLVLMIRYMSNIWAAGAGFDFGPALRMAAGHVGLALVLLTLATLAVRRVHLRELSRGERQKRRLFKRFPRWRPRIGDQPMIWKEAFAGTAKTRLGIIGWLAMIAIVTTVMGFILYWFWYALNHDVPRQFTELLYGMSAFIGSGLLLMAAARSASLITVEKERDTWVSLLSTPLSGGEIIGGKLVGNLYSLRYGIALLLFSWSLGCVFDARYAFVTGAMFGTLMLLLTFITALGLAFSARSSTSLRAMGMTLLVTLVLGGVYMMCCCPIAVAGGPQNDEMIEVGLAPCLPFLLMAPAMMFAETDSVRHFLTGYVFGLIGYSIALAVLLAYLVQGFEEIAGRGQLPEWRGGRREG